MASPSLDDLMAYVGTLDADEALGELQHLAQCYRRTAANARMIDRLFKTNSKANYDSVMVPLVFAIVDRIQEGTGGLTPKSPERGLVHTCDLLFGAIREGRRS